MKTQHSAAAADVGFLLAYVFVLRQNPNPFRLLFPLNRTGRVLCCVYSTNGRFPDSKRVGGSDIVYGYYGKSARVYLLQVLHDELLN